MTATVGKFSDVLEENKGSGLFPEVEGELEEETAVEKE